MSVLVEFQGERYWYLGEDLTDLGDIGYALAYLDHCDESGEVLAEHALRSHSFAHVTTTGEIKRYMQVIGTIGDLKAVADQKDSGPNVDPGPRGKPC